MGRKAKEKRKIEKMEFQRRDEEMKTKVCESGIGEWEGARKSSPLLPRDGACSSLDSEKIMQTDRVVVGYRV